MRITLLQKVLKPKAIIIENVSTVIHSKEQVVQQSVKLLEEMGYFVVQETLWANHFGVPQKRKRHFLLASKVSMPDLSMLDMYRMDENRTLRWAIEDLIGEYDMSDIYNQPAGSNEENLSRMNWLINNNE